MEFYFFIFQDPWGNVGRSVGGMSVDVGGVDAYCFGGIWT